MSNSQWWRDAVFYQVYPRSFADGNGDGEGDLAGIASRMDYLATLGIDALWLCPFYPSPMVDGGYDVADYTDVDPRYGSLEEFDQLVAAAHERGIRVTIDLVPNHCSSQHPWFAQAVAAGRGSVERERFLFREGRGTNGDLPPTNWASVFGGPSWTRVTEPDGSPGQWYYHLFAAEQPDFNWYHTDVLAEFKRIIRFWLERGVDGFRIDVSDALIKDFEAGDTADLTPVIPKGEDSAVHPIYRELRLVMDEVNPEAMAVIETGTTPETVALFLRPDEMHLAFNFAFASAAWEAGSLRDSIDAALATTRVVGAPATWVTDNHDTTRSVTRYGRGEQLEGSYVPVARGSAEDAESDGRADADADDHADASLLARGQRRARAAAALLLTLPGAAYIYQGQELGLPEVEDLPDEAIQDPSYARTGGLVRGRDGCRVPLPWAGSEPPYGFSDATATPWLPQPGTWAPLTVAAQEQTDESMLSLYRELLDLRHRYPVLGSGDVTWLQAAPGVLMYRLSSGSALDGSAIEGSVADHRDLIVVVTAGADFAELPSGTVVLTTQALTEAGLLAADAAAIVEQPRP